MHNAFLQVTNVHTRINETFIAQTDAAVLQHDLRC